MSVRPGIAFQILIAFLLSAAILRTASRKEMHHPAQESFVPWNANQAHLIAARAHASARMEDVRLK